MKEKVQAILRLMKVMNVTINDLQLFDDIEATKKFPLEVYYDDQTKSDDLEYYKKGLKRSPVGIVIGNTVFALPGYIDSIRCGDAEEYCQGVLGGGIVGSLPEKEQLEVLKEHIVEYDRIAFYLHHPELGSDDFVCLAVKHQQNSQKRQYYYNFGKGTVIACNGWVPTLPVINL